MRRTKYAVILACLALAAAGCGSSDGSGGSPKAGDGGPQDYQLDGGPGGSGGPGGPAGSGKVAAVSGSTAQVQNPTGQVAVSWTARTTFTQEVATRAAALEVGDCVVALPTMPATAGSGEEQEDGNQEDGNQGDGNQGDGNQGDGNQTEGPVKAATVRISAPVDGSCTRGIGPERGPDGEAPMEPPAGGNGTDGPPEDGLRRIEGSGAFGKVTAVTGSGFTVESSRPDEEATTTEVTTSVTTTGATTWTTTRPATAKAVVVGRCVTSMGRADSTGAIKAESIAVSSPVDGECALGFGGPRVMERDS